MAADRGTRGRRRPLRAGLVLGCSVALLAGCASMPDSGNLRRVDSSQRPDSQSQVRVYAMPPRDGAGPMEIVQGFLEALTSDDPKFAIARKYLTKEASKTWDPDRATTVLADGPSMVARNAGNDSGGRGFSLTGRTVATVNQEHAYQPEEKPYRKQIHLTREEGANGPWRIDTPPEGVVLGQSDFQRVYWSVNKYYYASYPTTRSTQVGLVADPIYVRQRMDPLTQTVKALLEGPTNWLRPVVNSRFPTGTRLYPGTKTLTPDDQGKLKVRLNEKADSVSQERCYKMAAQLLFTLQDLTSSGVEEVELQRSGGSQLCVQNRDQAEGVAPHHGVDRAPHQYFIDAEGRLVRMSSRASGRGGADPEPVPGPLGTGEHALSSAAVSRDLERAAGVSRDGRRLYMGSLDSAGALGKPEVVSRAKSDKDTLSAPSWDGRGDLWVADRDPKRQRLLWLNQGAGEPVPVKINGLDGRIEAVRVAADSARMALIVRKDGKTSLQIGRIERSDSKNGQPVSVAELKEAAPQMEEVTAMSWAGDSRLVVVGRESGGVQQIRYVQCDGSVPPGAALPGLTGVKEIAASEDDGQSLVAHSDDGIVRLPTGSQWQTVVKEGQAPVYPG